MRIEGCYPPPVPRSGGVGADAVAEHLLARTPRTTRYDRSPRARRPRAARLWSATSALLAAAGVGAVVLLPHSSSPGSARLDEPLAVAPPKAAASDLTMPTMRSTIQLDPAPPAPEPLQLPASRPTRIQIPALGVTSRVMELGLGKDGSMEVPPGVYPVGWYDRSPTPGQIGPAVLAGHVDWAGQHGAFFGLRELRAGDRIVIDRADGTQVTFQVDRVERHAKEEFPADEVYGDIDDAGLRLITCGGVFDEDTGDYLDNVIVFADLASIAP